MISSAFSIRAIPGIELTHVHPDHINELAIAARSSGAEIVVVHGETIAEPVMPGTNMAALKAPIDILAHPGLLSDEEAKRAAENSICLEISARKGHSLTNGHVVSKARKYKAPLVLNTDSHCPEDLISRERARIIAAGAGMSDGEIDAMFKNSEYLSHRSSR